MLFGLFGKRKPALVVDGKAKTRSKGGRPTKEVAAERRRLKLLDAETDIRVVEMEIRREEARQRLEELRKGKSARDLPLTVEMVSEIDKKLKPLGLGVRPTRGDGSTPDWERVLERGPELLLGLSTLLGARNGQATAPALPPGGGAAAPAGAEQAPAGEPALDPATLFWFIRAQIEARQPADAAAWLLAVNNDWIREFCTLITTTPDGKVFPMLDESAKAVPALGPFTAWLKSRQGWTLAVCAEIRRQHRPAQAPAPAPATVVAPPSQIAETASEIPMANGRSLGRSDVF